MMQAPVDWLLKGEAWVEYRTRLDLLGQSEAEPQVTSARASMLADPLVHALLVELSDWPGTVISSHKSAGQPFHKLTFIADLGLKPGDPGVDEIIRRILEHQSDEGPFQLSLQYPQSLWGHRRRPVGMGIMRCSAQRICNGEVRPGRAPGSYGGHRAPGGTGKG